MNRKKIGVIVNETNLKASGNVTLEQVRDLFKRGNLTAEIKTARARRLAEVARGFVSSGMDCIVAAGGDGTMSSIAAVLAGTRIPMGVLPIGTLNHFARDLGIPFDVEQAVRIITEGEPLFQWIEDFSDGMGTIKTGFRVRSKIEPATLPRKVWTKKLCPSAAAAEKVLTLFERHGKC